ncbi:hypothetical protein FRC12_018035, partial [Ceratobasidium sp. 428]
MCRPYRVEKHIVDLVVRVYKSGASGAYMEPIVLHLRMALPYLSSTYAVIALIEITSWELAGHR